MNGVDNKSSRVFFRGNLPFSQDAMNEKNPRYEQSISRESALPNKKFDLRTPFERDKNRILHSEGYDRLRFKTQVIYNPKNDMISTRSTHVALVTDIAKSIAKHLGLNQDLTEAIAMGHDLGHAPFGHDGERSLNKIAQERDLPRFWHEKNSLRMVDDILLLEGSDGTKRNLNLTYATRDGIVNHCGEINQNFIQPRHEVIDLKKLSKPAEVQPFTWEGIVVKIADKIAYLGRDIDDAKKMGLLKAKQLQDLHHIMTKHMGQDAVKPNNTNIVNLFIHDIVSNSTPDKGIGLSSPVSGIMDDIKEFNYKNIYLQPKVKEINHLTPDEIIRPVFDYYEGNLGKDFQVQNAKKNPFLNTFKQWMGQYAEVAPRHKDLGNKVLYNKASNPSQAVIDFISGMTDRYIISAYKFIKRHK